MGQVRYGICDTCLSWRDVALAACDAPVDLAFVLDSSSSVGLEDFRKMLNFVVSVLAHADIDSGALRLAVMTFSSEPKVIFHLNRFRHKSAALDAIRNIPYIKGSANLADALRTLRTEVYNSANGDRLEVPNVALIFTDGISNLNSERTIPEAVSTHASGVHLFVLGVGMNADFPEIHAVATPPPEDNLYLSDSFDDLGRIRSSMFAKICESGYRLVPENRHVVNTVVTAVPEVATGDNKVGIMAILAFQCIMRTTKGCN